MVKHTNLSQPKLTKELIAYSASSQCSVPSSLKKIVHFVIFANTMSRGLRYTQTNKWDYTNTTIRIHSWCYCPYYHSTRHTICKDMIISAPLIILCAFYIHWNNLYCWCCDWHLFYVDKNMVQISVLFALTLKHFSTEYVEIVTGIKNLSVCLKTMSYIF